MHFKKEISLSIKKVYDIFKKQTLIIKKFINKMLKKRYIRLNILFTSLLFLSLKSLIKNLNFVLIIEFLTLLSFSNETHRR